VLFHQLLQTAGQLLMLTHTVMDTVPIDAAVATIHHLRFAPFCSECDVALNEKMHFEVQFCEKLRNIQNYNNMTKSKHFNQIKNITHASN